MRKNDYERMPPIEKTSASYFSMGETFSLEAPSLPSEPLQRTSHLNGRAYAAAGQVVALLHMMAVLQAYQANLLKDKGQGLSSDEVVELRCTTDLALHATKQTATAMGRSMAAMVVTERHLARSEPKQQSGPGPSWSEDRRWAQKASVAVRAPPSPAGGSRRCREPNGGQQGLKAFPTLTSRPE
ncbi:D-alanine--D-alanine ligase A [Labeo rohita]|uniref:D-alanine--D-alanine ligase A n=1 Tax=Labeo rohita TaxID=84645 RepID=A0ABQ8MR23_LABRO|nr:D-alanine--D-alanine ligase A [Labeo rohita]